MNELNPKPSEQTTFPARIRVRTAGVWRAEQVSSTLLAIDRICGRVALGSLLAETCEAYDWAIRSYGFLGFLGKLGTQYIFRVRSVSRALSSASPGTSTAAGSQQGSTTAGWRLRRIAAGKPLLQD